MKTLWKWLLACALVTVLLCCCVTAMAANVVASGYCGADGENLSAPRSFLCIWKKYVWTMFPH